MAFPKKDLFSFEDQMLSNNARVLSHPARVHILKELQLNGGMFVHEIEDSSPLSPGTVSSHLNILRESKFVEVTCKGRYNYYSLNLPVLLEADLAFNVMFAALFGFSSPKRKSA